MVRLRFRFTGQDPARRVQARSQEKALDPSWHSSQRCPFVHVRPRIRCARSRRGIFLPSWCVISNGVMWPCPLLTRSLVLGSPDSSPVHTPSFYLPASSSRVQLIEQLDLLARHLQLPAAHLACTQQIIDLARWKEMHVQLGDLDHLALEARRYSIESTLATLSSSNQSPLLGTNSWDDSFLLGFDAPAAQYSADAFTSPHQQPDLSWSDIGSSAPTSPEVNVLGMTVEQHQQLFSSPLLYDPAAGDSHNSHIALPMLRHSPLSPMPAPLPEMDVLGLGLSHDSCFQSFDALFVNAIPEPAYTPSPHLPVSALDAPDMNTTACRLLLHSVTSSTNTPEIDNCLTELYQSFLLNDSLGADAVFAACVAACITQSVDQQKFFQEAVNRLAGGIVQHLGVGAMQMALSL